MVKKRKKESIFVSPDGGETVYEQLPNGKRILVEQSQRAKDEEQAYEEAEISHTAKSLGQISHRVAFNYRKSVICITTSISSLPAVYRRLCAFKGVIK